MADVKDPISALTAQGAAPDPADLIVVVDVSDPFQAATGTTKKNTVAYLFTAPALSGTATAVNIAATGTIRAGAASSIGFTGRTIVTAPSDGVLDVFHADGSTVGTLTANVQVNGGTVSFAEGVVRSWTMQATGGNLVIASGDAGGIVSIGSASIGLPATAITGTLAVSATLSVTTSITCTGGGVTHHSATLLATSIALTAGATGQSPTLTQGPVSGNPTKWVPINDNGTTRYIPTW